MGKRGKIHTKRERGDRTGEGEGRVVEREDLKEGEKGSGGGGRGGGDFRVTPSNP